VKAITCLVGQFNAPQQQVPTPLLLGLKDPAAYLNAASGAGGSVPALKLTLDYTQFGSGAGAPLANAYYLHSMLRDLTLNGPYPGCVDRIGLILADRYEDEPTAYGYMFDTGFDPATSDPTNNSVPREGCAIFLDAIRDDRASLGDYETEVGFTAVHELGHVFNLWHTGTPSLMAQSQQAAPYSTGAFHFIKEHRTYLSALPSPYVCPGGSNWDDRGTLVAAGGTSKNSPASANVRLRIGLPQPEFWRFEPAQLEVTVSTATGVEEARLQNVIDPGYEAFSIWIQDPHGARRAYKSPVKYCGNRTIIKVRRGQPFQRDISLFGQAGGYTFRTAGIHRIWCTLALKGRRLVTSNTVEAFVKPALPRSSGFRQLAPLLTDRRHARLLFYRSARRPMLAVDDLERAARKLPGTPSAANVRYSLGRAIITASLTRTRGTRRRYESTAMSLLNKALDSGRLTASRERRAEDVLDSLR
jgi:hypothetical protein